MKLISNPRRISDRPAISMWKCEMLACILMNFLGLVRSNVREFFDNGTFISSMYLSKSCLRVKCQCSQKNEKPAFKDLYLGKDFFLNVFRYISTALV